MSVWRYDKLFIFFCWKIFHLFTECTYSWNIFQHLERNFVWQHDHVKSSFNYLTKCLTRNGCVLFRTWWPLGLILFIACFCHSGAGMFVTTVVVGAISFVSTVKLTTRPFTRDVLFYLGAVSWMFIAEYNEKITLGESIGTYTILLSGELTIYFST